MDPLRSPTQRPMRLRNVILISPNAVPRRLRRPPSDSAPANAERQNAIRAALRAEFATAPTPSASSLAAAGYHRARGRQVHPELDSHLNEKKVFVRYSAALRYLAERGYARPSCRPMARLLQTDIERVRPTRSSSPPSRGRRSRRRVDGALACLPPAQRRPAGEGDAEPKRISSGSCTSAQTARTPRPVRRLVPSRVADADPREFRLTLPVTLGPGGLCAKRLRDWAMDAATSRSTYRICFMRAPALAATLATAPRPPLLPGHEQRPHSSPRSPRRRRAPPGARALRSREGAQRGRGAGCERRWRATPALFPPPDTFRGLSRSAGNVFVMHRRSWANAALAVDVCFPGDWRPTYPSAPTFASSRPGAASPTPSAGRSMGTP